MQKLKILSYNIHGLENKRTYVDFFQYIKTCDIFALLETHISDEKIESFTKFFGGYDLIWIPAERNSKFGRGVGGCCVGFKNCIKNKNFQYSFHKEKGINFIKLKIENQNVSIIPLYIRANDWINTLNCLEELFTEHQIENAIIIGDLNIRIGNKQQILNDEIASEFKSSTLVRKSKDMVINSKGNDFIKFCNDYGLYILNGTTLGDEGGSFTFISGVGESVNDICAVAHGALKLVESFQVDAKNWSDHLPIILNIQFKSTVIPNESFKLLPKLFWRDEIQLYRNRLNENLNLVKANNQSLSLANLSNIIKNSSKFQSQSFKAKSKWFNGSCANARSKSFKWLRKYQKTGNPEHKENYLIAYRNLKNKEFEAKVTYTKQLEEKINKVECSKQWWEVANEIRGAQVKESIVISAESFRTYFKDLLNPPKISADIQYPAKFCESEELDMPITLQEVKSVLDKAKPNKAPGEDRIPYEFYKNASDEFLSELVAIYNVIYDTSRVDEVFINTIIFPIFKKGDRNLPSNYRAISFMNVAAKVLMGVLNQRLYKWVENNNILNEYQAGFRRGYSTADNIFNLAAIVHLKFGEGKKVYAFFVDFKAAFDKVSRQALIFKLNNIGISNKLLNFIKSVYNDTKLAVWNGEELSDYFTSESGVKQGCLLSPLLFALYLNDLHEFVEGGLMIDEINVRLLMYADDIVILSDNIETLQSMIVKLESFCRLWNLEVNLTKSEIVVFRKGGSLSRREKWKFMGEEIKIVSEYKYLGVILTPKMVFTKHIEYRNQLAKNSINITWNVFLNKSNISLSSKWSIFQAICRAIQSYAAQVWGLSHFDNVDSLLIYFLKRILKLPQFTPTYIIMLETGVENSFLYTLNLNLKYIYKTLFIYSCSRLPHILTVKLLQKKLFCFEILQSLLTKYELAWDLNNLNRIEWEHKSVELLQKIKTIIYNEYLHKAASTNRIYKNLKVDVGLTYINNTNKPYHIMWVFKARSDLIELNATRFAINRSKLCSLCNMGVEETTYHFLGECPILKEIRFKYFCKITLSQIEIITILNENVYFSKLAQYIIKALEYRKMLINEFNY